MDHPRFQRCWFDDENTHVGIVGSGHHTASFLRQAVARSSGSSTICALPEIER